MFPTVNSYGRLHWVDGPEGPVYLQAVTVWRMMWGGGQERAILKGRLDGRQFIHNFPEGATLEIYYGDVRNPSERQDDYLAYRLTDCRTRRAWTFPMAMTSNEAAPLDVYLEVSCRIEKLR